jgi:hypothetical protein
MKNSYQVTGTNAKAPFTLKIHRGEGMLLLAINWREGKPPRDFVGFAIEYKEPKADRFWPMPNRIGFPGQRTKPSDPMIPSTSAPIQKFRWVHFPWHADKDGEFLYRVTPMFMDQSGTLSRGEPQDASIALMRETIPGKLNVAFTRGYVSSQSFVEKFAPDRKLGTLIPDDAKDGLTFKPTNKKAEEAYAWMGFEARASISEPADTDNGENLVLIKDRTVATSFMIEALRIYDHYRFRSAREDAKGKASKVLELQLPPKTPSGKPWWQEDWDDPTSKRDRELFA